MISPELDTSKIIKSTIYPKIDHRGFAYCVYVGDEIFIIGYGVDYQSTIKLINKALKKASNYVLAEMPDDWLTNKKYRYLR